MVFLVVRVEPQRRLNTEKLMLLNLVLEKTLKSPLDYKKIKPVNPKGNQPLKFIGNNEGEVKLQYFGHQI